MIAYVHCLSSGSEARRWRAACHEQDEELLPPSKRRMGNVPPKPEASLLYAKVHQKRDSLWTPKPLLGPKPSTLGYLDPQRLGRTLTCPPYLRWKGTGHLPFSVLTGHCAHSTPRLVRMPFCAGSRGHPGLRGLVQWEFLSSLLSLLLLVVLM